MKFNIEITEEEIVDVSKGIVEVFIKGVAPGIKVTTADFEELRLRYVADIREKLSRKGAEKIFGDFILNYISKSSLESHVEAMNKISNEGPKT